MTRTLTFGPDDTERFALFVNLFLSGGNVLHFNPQTGPTSRARADQKMEAQIVRAYKAISVEVAPGKKEAGRQLKLEGGVLTLEQPTFLLLERYLAAAPAGTQDADVVDDLIDWVSAAEKVEPKP